MSRGSHTSSVEKAVLKTEERLQKGAQRKLSPRPDAHPTLLDMRGSIAALAVAAAIAEMNRPIVFKKARP